MKEKLFVFSSSSNNFMSCDEKGKKEFVDICDYGLLSTLGFEYLREFSRSQKRCWAIASTNSLDVQLINTPILLKDLFLPVIPKPASVICKNSTPAPFAAIALQCRFASFMKVTALGFSFRLKALFVPSGTYTASKRTEAAIKKL